MNWIQHKQITLLISLLGLIGDIVGNAEETSRRCRYEEYRCKEGRACIKEEQLCNVVRDCPLGDDEGWTCIASFLKGHLESSCEDKHKTFKCRFGGKCISQNLVCDGEIDCRGGGDEAWDICGRTGLTPTTPKPSVFVVDDNQNKFCEGLQDEEGATISCTVRKRKVDCLSPVINGTVATYQCKPHFWPAAGSTKRTLERVCVNGKWTKRNVNWNCIAECGRSERQSIGFITAGTTSQLNKWPWHVGLYHQSPQKSGNWTNYCGATLVSTTAVLTAAHCVVEEDGTTLKEQIKLLFGKHLRNTGTSEKFVQEREPLGIKTHPNYNSQALSSDVAMITISPLEITDKVQPVCLPIEWDLEPGDYGTLVGWGQLSNGTFPKELQEANLEVRSFRKCVRAHPSLGSIVKDDTFCAGYTNGTSGCRGDSGCGFVSLDATTNHWTIYGVLSGGVPSRDRGCDPKYYTVFTKVTKYRDFIDTYLDQVL